MSAATPMDVPGALVAATESLCAEHDPSSVSMRQIAKATDISLGLAYYYFDSREALFGATLSNIAQAIDAAASTQVTAAGMASEVIDVLRERPAFSRIVASMVLSGADITAAMEKHPFLERMVTAASGGKPEGATDAGLVVSILLGASLFAPTVNRALGRELDDDQLHLSLEKSIVELLRTLPQ